MKATEINIGEKFKVRIFSSKWFRHYGGRHITQESHFVNVTLIGLQDGHQRYIVELQENCAGFNKGHKIAIPENDFAL